MNLSFSFINNSFMLNYTNNADNSTHQDYITFRHPADNFKERRLAYHYNIVIIYLLVVNITGVIGNLTILCIITGNRTLHRPPFYYILYIALADLCKSVFCLPFVSSVVMHDFTWKYGQNLCEATAFASMLFSFASLTGQFAAVIDRYIAMKAPRFYSLCSNAMISLTIIVFCTGIAFCFSFPAILNDGSFVFEDAEMQCTFNHDRVNEDLVRGYCITFIIILLTLLNLHYRVFSFLRAHRKMVPLENQPARSNNWNFFGPGANRQGLINVLNGFTGGPPAAFANAAQGFSHVGRVVHLRVTRCQHIPRTLFIVSLFLVIVWIPYLFKVLINSFLKTTIFSIEYVAVVTLLSHSHVALSALTWLFTGSPIRLTIADNLRTLRHKLYSGTSDTPSGQEEPIRDIGVEE